MNLTLIPTATWLAALVSLVLVISATAFVLQRLLSRHPQLFEELGRPSLFGSPFADSTWRLTAFIFQTRRNLQDHALDAACLIAARAGLVGLLFVGGSLITVLCRPCTG